MQLKHVLTAGHEVQSIHILCDQCEGRDMLLHFHQRVMAWVGANCFNGLPSPGIPVPDQLGVALKSLRGSELVWFVLRPQSRLCVAKGSQPALLGDSGAG